MPALILAVTKHQFVPVKETGIMMNIDDPIAFFITWTVYGTYLQGDMRGWRRRRQGHQLPQPRLAQWRGERLKYPILLLSAEQQTVVEQQCQRHCEHRDWHLWAVNARTNHVHAVVSASGYSGNTVRDQLKANCTRELREHWSELRDRQVWSVGGDWKCINSEDELENVCVYVIDAQNRKERDAQ